MNAQRILKEARPLFWPWCAVALAGALPLVHPPHSFEWIRLMVFLLGVPLLATLPLGNEFQHRTLSLLLSQPVSRMEIWGEKLGVAVVAAGSAVLVFFLSLRLAPSPLFTVNSPLAGTWIIAIIASATFWTLFARSTLGGMALNGLTYSFILIALNFTPWLSGTTFPLEPTGTPVVPTVTFVFLCYAGVMLWLGMRSLVLFQATGGMAGDDLLTAGPEVLPAVLVAWLRSRPTGSVLNLIRKEIRLLRPVWLISILAALYWVCLSLFGLLYERGFSRQFETAVIIHWVVSTLVISILAGCLSLGEERTSGTHAWHLTLPSPTFLQWGIKLSMALFASFVGAGLIPIIIWRRPLSGAPNLMADMRLGNGWLLVVLLLTFASFWCACAVKGTVPAVLWVLPVVIVLGFANVFGGQAGARLMDLVVSRFDLFRNFRFAHAVSSWVWSDPPDPRHWIIISSWFRYTTPGPNQWNLWLWDTASPTVLALLWGPTLLLAEIQSYRLFRGQLQDSTLLVVRKLLPLAILAFLCSFSLSGFSRFVIDAKDQSTMPIIWAHHAIEKILADSANRDAALPLQLTGDDVDKAFISLPEGTRRWLHNARITVTPDKAQPCGRRGNFTWWYYSATIHLASGRELTVSYEPPEDSKSFPRLNVRVHWPGTVGQELLMGR